MDLILSVLPIVLLIYLMVKRNALPSYVALPLIAGLVYIIHLTYFDGSFLELNANFISAIISVMTPITVIFGAVLFNRMMEMTGAMDVLRRWLGNISPNPVAQLMIIGWAFAFMRGRTLDNAFVILDEAQNTTHAQMKMFLTRMGRNAKFMITGDPGQVDLPRKVSSGLKEAMLILQNVKGIAFLHLDDKDVVRHPLVRSIIDAYKTAENNQ